jgi:hypothetical protein
MTGVARASARNCPGEIGRVDSYAYSNVGSAHSNVHSGDNALQKAGPFH